MSPGDGAPSLSRWSEPISEPIDCAFAREHLLADQRGALDPGVASALAAHLASCPACAREDQAERLLTEQLERHLPQHAAPVALKRRLAAQWPAPRVAPRRHAWLGRAAAVAVVALAALALAIAGSLWARSAGTDGRVVAEAVNDHLRILARAHPLDVQSTDVHQLRPWLTSHLDFAPVIPFAGDAEFPLRGGTTEYFLDRRAGVAVYGRRLHTVTLIVTRSAGLPWPTRATAARERGFNVRLWQANGLAYALVSDVDAADLADLAARLGG